MASAPGHPTENIRIQISFLMESSVGGKEPIAAAKQAVSYPPGGAHLRGFADELRGTLSPSDRSGGKAHVLGDIDLDLRYT